MNKKRISAVLMIVTAFFVAALLRGSLPPSAHAEEAWKTEFNAICSKTTDPASLTKSDLQDLILRCDALKQRIEKLDESARKVYLRRIQMCRDLFQFTLENPPSP